MRLAQSYDLHGIVGERVPIPGDKGANASGKVAAVVAGMLTGADSIDDLDVIRHGGMPALFGSVYAPSTLASSCAPSPRPRSPTPGGGEGVPDPDRPTHAAATGRGSGHAKVGGYRVLLRGLNPLVATISTPDAAPVIAATQLRAGNAGSARGAASLVAEAIAPPGPSSPPRRARWWCGLILRSTVAP
jgi:hypothetical protein